MATLAWGADGLGVEGAVEIGRMARLKLGGWQGTRAGRTGHEVEGALVVADADEEEVPVGRIQRDFALVEHPRQLLGRLVLFFSSRSIRANGQTASAPIRHPWASLPFAYVVRRPHNVEEQVQVAHAHAHLQLASAVDVDVVEELVPERSLSPPVRAHALRAHRSRHARFCLTGKPSLRSPTACRLTKSWSRLRSATLSCSGFRYGSRLKKDLAPRARPLSTLAICAHSTADIEGSSASPRVRS